MLAHEGGVLLRCRNATELHEGLIAFVVEDHIGGHLTKEREMVFGGITRRLYHIREEQHHTGVFPVVLNFVFGGEPAAVEYLIVVAFLPYATFQLRFYLEHLVEDEEDAETVIPIKISVYLVLNHSIT